MLFTQILGKKRERKGLGTHRVRVRRSWWRRMRTRRSAAHDKGKRWGGRRQIWRWQRACGTIVVGGAIKLEGLGGSGLLTERVSTPAAEVEVDGAQVVAGKTPRGRAAVRQRGQGRGVGARRPCRGGLVRRRPGGAHARWSSTGSGALRSAGKKSSGGAGSGGATAGCGVGNGLGVSKRQPRHVGAGQDGERGCRRWP
ncbi:leucine-rich repeat extensin-like protein 3 [Iris pallida]|uniref:Leucine-rich repeat extensin-like protein 3 n=1 Tax=Iris pallida TaxID=29817 RepID=A0AAX6HYR8_IRIPA|nr:leucine-rich repeat extensin-like protein 3 [Iris pallida]